MQALQTGLKFFYLFYRISVHILNVTIWVHFTEFLRLRSIEAQIRIMVGGEIPAPGPFFLWQKSDAVNCPTPITATGDPPPRPLPLTLWMIASTRFD